jgi:hypothetical protein
MLAISPPALATLARLVLSCVPAGPLRPGPKGPGRDGPSPEITLVKVVIRLGGP